MNLLLDGGGRASGQSGCNRFSASYTQSGAQLQFSQAAGTRMMCVQPEGVMQFEAWMRAALTSVAAWSMEGDVLTLRTVTGATALTLKK
jgi:heat shock protein HslJ